MPSLEPDEPDQEFQWTIVNVSIFDHEGQSIYHKNYHDSDFQVHSDLITGILSSLDTFSNEAFSETLQEIGVGDHRLFFHVTNAFVIVTTTQIGKAVRTGPRSELNLSVAKFMKRLSEALSIIYYSNNSTLPAYLLDQIMDIHVVSILNERNANKFKDYIPVQSEEDPKDWKIVFALIADDTGYPLVSRVYNNDVVKNDPVLITCFLTSINLFFSSNFEKHLEDMVLGRYRIYFKFIDEKLYVLIVEFETEAKTIKKNSEISRYIYDLLDNMYSALTLMSDDDSYITEETFKNVTDSLVFESLNQGSRNKDSVEELKSELFGSRN